MYNCIFCTHLFIKDIKRFPVAMSVITQAFGISSTEEKGNWLYLCYNFLAQLSNKRMEITGGRFRLRDAVSSTFWPLYQKCCLIYKHLFRKFHKVLWGIACVFCYYFKPLTGSVLTEYLKNRGFGQSFADLPCIRSSLRPVHLGGYEETMRKAGPWRGGRENKGRKFGVPARVRGKEEQPRV